MLTCIIHGKGRQVKWHQLTFANYTDTWQGTSGDNRRSTKHWEGGRTSMVTKTKQKHTDMGKHYILPLNQCPPTFFSMKPLLPVSTTNQAPQLLRTRRTKRIKALIANFCLQKINSGCSCSYTLLHIHSLCLYSCCLYTLIHKHLT